MLCRPPLSSRGLAREQRTLGRRGMQCRAPHGEHVCTICLTCSPLPALPCARRPCNAPPWGPTRLVEGEGVIGRRGCRRGFASCWTSRGALLCSCMTADAVLSGWTSPGPLMGRNKTGTPMVAGVSSEQRIVTYLARSQGDLADSRRIGLCDSG